VINLASLDTNILIYAVDNSNLEKQEICYRLVEQFIRVRGRLPLQCLNEFYALTTRRSLLQPAQARTIVERLLGSLLIIPSTSADTVLAMQMQERHKIQFFDALLLATAIRAGSSIFLSEDMQDGRTYDGITVRNPLAPGFDIASLS
jgi:predicted nucleic acid-binding protein